MTDAILKHDIIDELDFEPSIDATHVAVSVDDGTVTLSGHVRSYTEKCTAEAVVKRMKGVRAIAQEIEVRPAGAHLTADDEIARRELALESAIAKLDKYHLLVLDDLAYVTKDQAETSVLFELISARYERRSTLITANQPFGDWSRVFPDPAMTLAAVDRLVHHSTIFEMNVESYRRRAALQRQSS